MVVIPVHYNISNTLGPTVMLSASAASTLPGPQHADHHQDDLYIFRLGYSRDGMEQTTQNMLKSNWEAFLLPHFWRLHVQIPPPKKTVEPAKKNLSEVFTHRIHVWYVYPILFG